MLIELTAHTDTNTQKKTPTSDRQAVGNVEHAEGSDPSVAKNKTVWHCPRCGIRVTTYVPVTQTLTHPCVRKANKTIPLQKEEGNE